MSGFKVYYKDQAHAHGNWRAVATMQHWWPRAETTEVEAHIATYSLLVYILMVGVASSSY